MDWIIELSSPLTQNSPNRPGEVIHNSLMRSLLCKVQSACWPWRIPWGPVIGFHFGTLGRSAPPPLPTTHVSPGSNCFGDVRVSLITVNGLLLLQDVIMRGRGALGVEDTGNFNKVRTFPNLISLKRFHKDKAQKERVP